MSNWIGVPILAAGVAMIFDCSQQPSVMAATIEDKTYADPPVEGDPYTEEGERADVSGLARAEGRIYPAH